MHPFLRVSVLRCPFRPIAGRLPRLLLVRISALPAGATQGWRRRVMLRSPFVLEFSAMVCLHRLFSDPRRVALAGMCLAVSCLLAACDGNTPLMTEVMHGRVDDARTMIEQGADVNARNNYGWTALSHAARIGNVELVRLLIAHGADVNVQDESGWTPLMRAAMKGNSECADVLIEHGARVDLQDNTHSTALHWAARRGHVEIVQRLLSAGADLRVKNDQGWTPMMAAAEGGYNNVILLLRQAGARE